VLVDAPRALELALDAGAKVGDVFTCSPDDPVLARAAAAGAAVHLVAPATLSSIADAATPQGLAAVVEHRTAGLDDLGPAGPVVVLDAVQDPGNVGAVIRSAAAVGAAGVVLGTGSADPTSPRAVRGSAGTLFALPVVAGVDVVAALDQLAGAGFDVVGAAPGGDPPAGRPPRSPRLALVLGSEAHGVSEGALRRCRQVVSLPMAPPVESLNVAVTAGVLLYLLAPPEAATASAGGGAIA
jgi:TrmH family RNA methyltransferase